MATILISLMILASFLLVLFVLAQNSKGGIGGQFGGGGVSQIVGAKKGADLLEKLTWGCAIFIMVGSVLANVMYSGSGEERVEDINSNIEVAKSKSVLPNGLENAPASEEEAE